MEKDESDLKTGKAIITTMMEDSIKVWYRPSFARLTGSPLAAILLQQILFRWNDAPFWKFRQPCQHSKYREGDSWLEELCWNKNEFDHTLKLIGTKVTKGISKKDILSVEYPERQPDESNRDYLKRYATALQALVIYWTDGSRVTWYDVNIDLLAKFVNRIYLDKSEGRFYLEKTAIEFSQVSPETGDRRVIPVSGFTFSSENLSKKTNKKRQNKDSPAAAGTGLEPAVVFVVEGKDGDVAGEPENVPSGAIAPESPAGDSPPPIKFDWQGMVAAVGDVFNLRGVKGHDMVSMLSNRSKATSGAWHKCRLDAPEVPEGCRAPMVPAEVLAFGLWYKESHDIMCCTAAEVQSQVINYRLSFKPAPKPATAPPGVEDWRVPDDRYVPKQSDSHVKRLPPPKMSPAQQRLADQYADSVRAKNAQIRGFS